jgi:hypothetical protein
MWEGEGRGKGVHAYMNAALLLIFTCLGCCWSLRVGREGGEWVVRGRGKRKKRQSRDHGRMMEDFSKDCVVALSGSAATGQEWA